MSSSDGDEVQGSNSGDMTDTESDSYSDSDEPDFENMTQEELLEYERARNIQSAEAIGSLIEAIEELKGELADEKDRNEASNTVNT